MNWEAIGVIAEVVAAIAVVATLIYLAVEIRTARIGAAAGATYSAIEAFSRWRASILQNSELAETVTKANRGEPLTDQEQLQFRTLADDLFVVVVVGGTEIEQWGLDRRPPDIEYLKMIFEENPGLVPLWQRYRRVAKELDPNGMSAIDNVVAELESKV